MTTKSTCINWINFVDGNMDVEYTNGARYRYYNVPLTTYMAISNANSRGKTIKTQLRDTGIAYVKHDRRFKRYG